MTNITHGEVHAWHWATRQPVRLGWQEGTITHLTTADPLPPRDVWIAPALFDVQVNGYGGVDFQQDNLSADNLLSAARHLRALRSQVAELQSAIVGWHVEGPFLSAEPGFHGAHNPALMRNPTSEDIHEMCMMTDNDTCLL